MPLPQSFLAHLQLKGYHPRSDKHSKALVEAIVEDLMADCAPMRARAAADGLVFQHNFDVEYGQATWNTDLAIGPPLPSADLTSSRRVGGMAGGCPGFC